MLKMNRDFIIHLSHFQGNDCVCAGIGCLLLTIELNSVSFKLPNHDHTIPNPHEKFNSWPKMWLNLGPCYSLYVQTQKCIFEFEWMTAILHTIEMAVGSRSQRMVHAWSHFCHFFLHFNCKKFDVIIITIIGTHVKMGDWAKSRRKTCNQIKIKSPSDTLCMITAYVYDVHWTLHNNGGTLHHAWLL